MNRWETNFGSLLKPPEMSTDERAFSESIKLSNSTFEQSMSFGPDTYLNREIDRTEVSKIVQKSKNNKAPGIDSLTYEVLKNEPSINALTALFNKCLSSGMVPNQWVRGIIKPIPKSASSDPRVPLNYRGISLLSVVSKLYTALLSDRVSGYLESSNLLANEQNGFRSDRSCLDHIFTLNDILRVRRSQR